MVITELPLVLYYFRLQEAIVVFAASLPVPVNPLSKCGTTIHSRSWRKSVQPPYRYSGNFLQFTVYTLPPPIPVRVFSTSDLAVHGFWSKMQGFAVTLMMDLHVKLCDRYLRDETIFWQTVFFRGFLRVCAIAKIHKNITLTPRSDRNPSDGIWVL